jgi:hypothetical protein
MVGWIEIEGTPFAGPLFQWIEGETPERLSAAGASQVGRALRHLHADARLARDLAGHGELAPTCADYYGATYHDRFAADLVFVRRHPPPFVNERRLDWMWREAETLLERVRASKAFGEVVTGAAHGDCWLNNLLETRAGGWHLLDWDELGLGDPVVDWAMLFGPSPADPRPAPEASVRAAAELADSEWARLDVYARASVLDWVIDSLADWVDAARAPVWTEAVRQVKRDAHERALDVYRDLYR